ncbi:MAG TPA: MurR/RpiR family transcriptional regulator [Lachnospiraceae bacterium]
MPKSVLEIIQEKYNDVFAAERKVADFILKEPNSVIHSTVAEVAKLSGVSNATVVRLCHHLGFKGYYQFRMLLAKDLGRFQENNLMPTGVDGILTKYVKQIYEISKNLDEKMIFEVVDIIKKCSELHIIAAGNTIPMALYMSFRLGRVGIKSTAGIASEYYMNSINLSSKEGVVLAISMSGETKQVIQGIQLAKEKGMETIAITGTWESSLGRETKWVLSTDEQEGDDDTYRYYSRLKEIVMIDLLLELITSGDKIRETDAERPEEYFATFR